MTSDLQELFETRALSELARADAVLPGAGSVSWHGYPLARTLILKGVPARADVQAGHALAGEDGTAARKALDALGVDGDSVLAGCTRASAEDESEAVVGRLTLAVEAVDPGLIVAVDGQAAEDLAAAADLDHLTVGEPVTVHGRILLAVGDLAASLANEALKREVWSAFKALAGRH